MVGRSSSVVAVVVGGRLGAAIDCLAGWLAESLGQVSELPGVQCIAGRRSTHYALPSITRIRYAASGRLCVSEIPTNGARY